MWVVALHAKFDHCLDNPVQNADAISRTTVLPAIYHPSAAGNIAHFIATEPDTDSASPGDIKLLGLVQFLHCNST